MTPWVADLGPGSGALKGMGVWGRYNLTSGPGHFWMGWSTLNSCCGTAGINQDCAGQIETYGLLSGRQAGSGGSSVLSREHTCLGRELELVFWEAEELPGWELGPWAANILRGFSPELGVPDNCGASC